MEGANSNPVTVTCVCFFFVFFFDFIVLLINTFIDIITIVPTKSDSDIKLCLQLSSKKLTCTLHLI